MAAITEVPRASIYNFETTFPSFYNHEIIFAISNKCLVYGIKWIKKFAIKFVKHTKFERFCVLFTSMLYGMTRKVLSILSHIFETYTNLFLTLSIT